MQAKLSENLRGRRLRRQSSNALLLGKLFDDHGNAMTPSYAIKKGVRYRYYVSCVLAQGRKEEAGSVPRVAAEGLERIILDSLAVRETDLSGVATRTEAPRNPNSNEIPNPDSSADSAIRAETIVTEIDRVTLGGRSMEVRFHESADHPERVISIPWSPATFRRKREVIGPPSETANGARPIRAEARTKLLSAIAKGRRWLDEIISGSSAGIEAIAARENISERTARMGLSLAFLAPDIVQAAFDATLPRGLGVSRLMDMPPNWADQRNAIGVAPRG